MDEGVENEVFTFEPKFQAQRMNIFALLGAWERGDGFKDGGEGVIVDVDAGSSEQIE